MANSSESNEARDAYHRDSLSTLEGDLNEVEDCKEALLEPQTQSPKKNHSVAWLIPSIICGLIVLVILQAIYIGHMISTQNKLFTSSNGISTKRNIERQGSLRTKYSLRNETEASAAWEEIEAGHGLVAVDLDWAAARNLPETELHPGDSSKAVYVMEAYHNIHCIKILRRHYMVLEAGGEVAWPREHDLHCFDTLRQHVMCLADDTLLKTRLHRDAGEGQTRQCRDWDAIRDWATEHTACYHDDFPAEWGRCDGGVDGLLIGSILD